MSYAVIRSIDNVTFAVICPGSADPGPPLMPIIMGFPGAGGIAGLTVATSNDVCAYTLAARIRTATIAWRI
jgi:hypothetical protein